MQTVEDKSQTKDRSSKAYKAKQCLFVGYNQKVFFFSKPELGGIQLNIIKTPEILKQQEKKAKEQRKDAPELVDRCSIEINSDLYRELDKQLINPSQSSKLSQDLVSQENKKAS